MKILLVEDDEILVASLVADLASQNYVVEAVTDGNMGLSYAQATQYDLIVLDVNLPGTDGITLCRQLRQDNYEGPILLLTATGDSNYKVQGLDAGADDYVVKPCPTEELSARIRALLRRPREVSSSILQWGALQLNPSTCQVYFAENNISLSPKEYGILELFLRNPQRVFSSTVLLERLWGFDEMPGEETIRSHIKRLRRKLKQAGADEVIENIYGMGYRLMPAPLATTPPQTPSTNQSVGNTAQQKSVSPSPPNLNQTPLQAKLSSALPTPPATEAATTAQAARSAALAALRQFSDVLTERIEILEAATNALKVDNLSDELQRSAQQAAHKLAGSLGMFGLAEGSHLSQKIEICLQETPLTIEADQLFSWIKKLRRDIEVALETADSKKSADSTASQPLLQEPSKTVTSNTATSDIATNAVSLPLLLVVTVNLDWRTDVQVLAQNIVQLVLVDDLKQAQEQLSQNRPDTVLVDLEITADLEETQIFLTNLTVTHPNSSVLIRTHQDTFERRLAIARYCSCTFLPHSASIPSILNNVVENYRNRSSNTFHILVVDDDPIILKALEHQLPPWGLHVTTLEDSRRLWEMLPQLKPDLLMLDVEMPHVDGIQLCYVIRSDQTWGNLPILFLTARRDIDTVQQIFQAGADDYIAKPFAEAELVARILNRLERQRLSRKLAIIDPVTGLITEQHVLRDISRDLAIAQRYRQPYCLAVIQVNVQPLASNVSLLELEEAVVCYVANTFNQKLRREDLLTQTASNNFLLGLYGIHKKIAEERIVSLIEEIKLKILETLSIKNASLSFHIGLAAAPEEGENVSSLRQLAEISQQLSAGLEPR